MRFMMRIVLLAVFLISPSFINMALASESISSDLISLDENTFVKIDKSNDNLETIQLFIVEENRINLIDAIQIEEKNINLKPSYEFQRLKIKSK